MAVRSSATAEDLPEASFAGQQETYLNICGPEAVLLAVQRCWASLWTARAIGYRLTNGIAQQSIALAVVVQELVPADVAGVMFTANPLNGRREQVVINAAWGLGEAVVSGTVTPDTVTLDKRTGTTVQRRIADKKVMTVRTQAGTGERPVPAALRRKPALSAAQAGTLVRLGAQVEELYGRPMDIEWVLSGGRFALVQARPITSLPEAPLDWTSPHPKALLTRMSFAEFVPDPVSPLFATLGVPIARDASLALMGEFMGRDDPNTYIFSVVNDYIYIGMVLDLRMVWAMLVQVLGGVMQKMLKTSQARWTAEREKYRRRGREMAEERASCFFNSGAADGGERDLYQHGEILHGRSERADPIGPGSELSFGRFYRALVKRRHDPDESIFLLGLDNFPLRAEKSLFDLAQWIKTQPGLAGEVLKLPAKEILARLQDRPPLAAEAPAWTEFRTALNNHLAEFGHTIYDLDFSRPVPADDPAPLLEAIKAHLEGKGSNPYARQQAAAELREQTAQAIAARLDPLRRKWFQELLSWAQVCAPMREDCISEVGWGYPLLRRIFFELGRRLSQRSDPCSGRHLLAGAAGAGTC